MHAAFVTLMKIVLYKEPEYRDQAQELSLAVEQAFLKVLDDIIDRFRN